MTFHFFCNISQKVLFWLQVKTNKAQSSGWISWLEGTCMNTELEERKTSKRVTAAGFLSNDLRC